MEKYQLLSDAPSSWMLQNSSLTDERLDSTYYSPCYLDDRNELETSGFEVVNLSTICEKLNCGATPKLVEYSPSGTPLIRTSNVRPNLYVEGGVERVANFEIATESNVAVLPGDLLYTMSGSVGYASVYPSRQELASYSNTIARGRIAQESEFDAYFVAGFLNSRLGYSQSMRLVSGGVLGHVMPNPLKRLRIPKAPCDVQIAIGNKFRKAERLQQIAKSKWQTSLAHLESGLGQSATPPPIESLKPSDLTQQTYSCLSVEPPVSIAVVNDEIAAQYFHPRRISAQQIASGSGRTDLLRNVATRRRKRKSEIPPTEFVGLDALNANLGFIQKANVDPYDGETGCSSFVGREILFSRLRPYLNKVAIWPDESPVGFGSGELLVYTAKSIDPYYLFFILKSDLVLNQVIDATAGSTHPRVDADVVDSTVIPRLDETVEDLIGEEVRTAHQMLYEAQDLIPHAMDDIEALMLNTCDIESLLENNAIVAKWLQQNSN